MKRKGFLIGLIILVLLALFIWINPEQLFTKLMLRMMGHYATPQYESVESIRSTVTDASLYYDRLYRISDLQAMQEMRQQNIFQIPFVQIYDRKKQSISMASGSECKWALMNFFNEEDTAQYISGDTSTYTYIMDRLESIDIKSYQDTFDYYMIAGWANYAPRLSDSLFEQTNRIKNSSTKKVCVAYINLDYQKEWEHAVDSLQQSN